MRMRGCCGHECPRSGKGGLRLGLPLETGLLLGQHSDQLGPDLVKPAAIRFALFLEQMGELGRQFQMSFGVALDLEVHHFLKQRDKVFGGNDR